MTDMLNQITNLADELTDSRLHREPIYTWTETRNRKATTALTTIQPGLLEQLREAIYPSSGSSEEHSTRPIPASKPPLLLEALGHHMAISMGANRWIWSLHLTNRGTPEANIRTLVGAAGNLDSDTLPVLLADLRRWRNWAAVMTGWATPPMTPRVPCPNCAKLSTLRIVAERRSALCSGCDHVWDDTDSSIDALAQWVARHTDTPMPRMPIGSTIIGHGGWQTRAS